MLKAFIFCEDRTIHLKRGININKKDFTYHGGIYFIKREKIVLRRGIFFYTPYSIYIEGYSEPLDLNNIEIKQIKDKDGNVIDIPQNIFINAVAIHEMTSRKLLSVLVNDAISTFELLLIILMFGCLIASIIAIFT